MTWDYFVSSGIDLYVKDRIDRESALRQERTAERILQRLAEQPGVILADEVGMGKTFVALAVGISIALVNRDAGPVVVMVPGSVKTKWPRDFSVFRERCLKDKARELVREVPETVEHGIDFLKLLDDPPERRRQIVFLTHGALSGGLTDPWVKLALMRHVFGRRRQAGEVRDVFPRFAPALLQLKSRSVDDELIETLMKQQPAQWRRTIERAGIEMDDDPVPEALVSAIDTIPADALDLMAEGLSQMPRRASANIDERITLARRTLAHAFSQLWVGWLSEACRRQRLPLLILDEAHHLKNPSTRLASLFQESADDAQAIAGPLAGVFERMLFLTATPFQLGHAELLRVLDRFANIAWKSEHAPSRSREQFESDLGALTRALDKSQLEALGLERAWGRLREEHVVDEGGAPVPVDAWWSRVLQKPPQDGYVADVAQRFHAAQSAAREAERLLSPWVIRHMKERRLPERDIARRRVLAGAGILDEDHAGRGLEIGGRALLPFLLAARAQASIAEAKAGRALFAEGLASSFEAYRDTRAAAAERDEDDEGLITDDTPADVAWYLQRIEAALPREKDDAASSHPKVAATVERVLHLFRHGEKALVFCHYRATGRALERHISRAIDDVINTLASERLGVSVEKIGEHLDLLGKRFNDSDSPLRREADERLNALVSRVTDLTVEDRDRVVDVMRRFLRTPSFLARYFPGDVDAPIARALEQPDASGLPLGVRLEDFCRFLAVRCTAIERAEYLDALRGTQTGERYARDDAQEQSTGPATTRLLPNVRLANGATRDEVRRRLLLSFNTPFFPEVLIASSVLAEGVDLHLNCRFVIHHDLCWNPSTLEQRTGRIDRLGAKAEKCGAPIHVFMPYVAATQDEKMFRVVSDRERWFQVVMGEKFEIDEASTDKNAARIELPETVSAALGLRLAVADER